MSKSRKVKMPDPVRRESRELGVVSWYATEQEAEDAEFLLSELGLLNHDTGDHGRRRDLDTIDGFAVLS